MGCCSSRAQVQCFQVDCNGDEHVYRVHPIDAQLVPYPVIMPVSEEHGCNSVSESFNKHEQRDISRCHVERRDHSFAVAERTER